MCYLFAVALYECDVQHVPPARLGLDPRSGAPCITRNQSDVLQIQLHAPLIMRTNRTMIQGIGAVG